MGVTKLIEIKRVAIEMESLNIGSVSVGEHDADWLRVMSAVSGSSLRSKAGSVLSYYVRRRKDEYAQIIAYTAAKHGLTFDECFKRLLRNESLGEPLPDFPVQAITLPDDEAL